MPTTDTAMLVITLPMAVVYVAVTALESSRTNQTEQTDQIENTKETDQANHVFIKKHVDRWMAAVHDEKTYEIISDFVNTDADHLDT